MPNNRVAIDKQAKLKAKERIVYFFLRKNDT